jgi:hypothetical protein
MIVSTMSDSDDLQVTYRGQLYRRIAVEPYIRADGSTTKLAEPVPGVRGGLHDHDDRLREPNRRDHRRPARQCVSKIILLARIRHDPHPPLRGSPHHPVRPNAPSTAHLAPANAVDAREKVQQWPRGWGFKCGRKTGPRNRTDAHAQNLSGYRNLIRLEK